MLGRLKSLNNRSDTIVEVIIVLAVLGSAVSITYATANRSLLGARQAQETSQAAELVQSQLETLRTMTNNPQYLSDGVTPNPDYIFPPAAQPFCVTTDASGTAHVKYPSDMTLPCHFNLYDVEITYVQNATAVGGKFTIQTSWDDVEGQGKDMATLVYNLYQPPLQ